MILPNMILPLRGRGSGRVGGKGWIERHTANDQLFPAPHRTERTDFPYSALRTHSSVGFPCSPQRQRIESVASMQLLIRAEAPQPVFAVVFAPNPAAQLLSGVILQPIHHS